LVMVVMMLMTRLVICVLVVLEMSVTVKGKASSFRMVVLTFEPTVVMGMLIPRLRSAASSI
jgi:hypothetical protein